MKCSFFFNQKFRAFISFYLESKTNLKQETNVEILLSVNQLLVSFVSASLILLLRSDDEEIATDNIFTRDSFLSKTHAKSK